MSRVQTDVVLPPLKKLAPPDCKTKERLFVVFSPSQLPPDVLEDVFWSVHPALSVNLNCLLISKIIYIRHQMVRMMVHYPEGQRFNRSQLVSAVTAHLSG